MPLVLSPGLQAFEGVESCPPDQVLSQSQDVSEGTDKQTGGGTCEAIEAEDQARDEQQDAQASGAPVQKQELHASPPTAYAKDGQQQAAPMSIPEPGSTAGQAPAQILPTCMHVVPATPVLPCALAAAPSTQLEDSLPMGSVPAAPETQPGPADPVARLQVQVSPAGSAHALGQHCEHTSAGSSKTPPAQQMAAMSSQVEIPLAVACSPAPSLAAAAAASESAAEPLLPFSPTFWGTEVGANPLHISEVLGADDDLFTAWHLGGYGAGSLETYTIPGLVVSLYAEVSP